MSAYYGCKLKDNCIFSNVLRRGSEDICNAVNNNIGYKFIALYMKLIEINSYACIVTKCLGNKFTSFKLLNPLPILKHSFTQTIDPQQQLTNKSTSVHINAKMY